MADDIHDQVVTRLKNVLITTSGPLGGMIAEENAEELYVLIQAIAADVVRQIGEQLEAQGTSDG